MILERDTCKLYFALVLLISIVLLPEVDGHQLFNSEERKIGGYKIAVTTDPEIPGPNSASRLLVAITDYDNNDLIDVRAGLKIFKNDVLIHEVNPRIYIDGHIDLQYTFPESGMYIVEVDVLNPSGNEISSKFNIGILQAFGYIFYSMIIIGAFFPVTLVGVILFMKRRKAKQAQN